ncbi:MAG TPA: hypothetical protein ACQGQW_06600, partial [Xylella fastidiosa subsp. pauca]
SLLSLVVADQLAERGGSCGTKQMWIVVMRCGIPFVRCIGTTRVVIRSRRDWSMSVICRVQSVLLFLFVTNIGISASP